MEEKSLPIFRVFSVRQRHGREPLSFASSIFLSSFAVRASAFLRFSDWARRGGVFIAPVVRLP